MDPQLRAAFVLEQALGHITHGANLERLVAGQDRLTPAFLRIPFDLHPRQAIIPGFGNWTIRAGMRARRAIRRQYRAQGIDVMFIHTQVPALLAQAWMKRIATVVSLDATPLQIDEMSVQYNHRSSSERVERWKFEINRRCFLRADQLVAWSEWTRDSLVQDYGIRSESVTVIAPGVDFSRWGIARPDKDVADHPVRVLFVGGGLERKGGLLLLEAARRLRADPGVPEFEVHLVTGTEVPDEPGIVIHNAMTPNSPALVELYQKCDIFCLPTLGDCLPLVLAEAAACSMALVSTNVGAISEVVRNGDTGVLIEPGDLDSLEGALRRLLLDPVERRRLGAAAHELARKEHDASVNAERIVDLLVRIGHPTDSGQPVRRPSRLRWPVQQVYGPLFRGSG